MKITAVHQFSFAMSSGSGVTNGMFYTQKLLRELGLKSQLFSTYVSQDLQLQVEPLERLKADPHALILVHHCLGYDNTEWLFDLPNPKVMVYHNITPPELLPANSEIAHYAVLGREQLRDWSGKFIAAIGDSALNTSELNAHKYSPAITIPMLIDFERFTHIDLNPSVLNKWNFLSDSFNLLFVGRICENKNQLELIETLMHLRNFADSPVKLILAGEVTSGEYQSRLIEEVERVGLEGQVIFTGKLSEASLAALYRQCDVFVCLSAHEGFGMPLIEAMHFGLPVVARASSSVSDTMGGAGWLLAADQDAYHVAAALRTLMREHGLRRAMLEGQAQRLKAFEKPVIKGQLARFLGELGVACDCSNTSLESSSTKVWQIEGPFDSSYSLAIVNRELGLALAAQDCCVKFRSHEGGGDFLPDSNFLATYPEILHRVSVSSSSEQSRHYPDIAMRFCYPPLLNDMPAGVRVVHSYGWEETGFPQRYVDEFNRRADLITVLSKTVAKILRESGVRVPIAVTGAGVDHLKSESLVDVPAKVKEQLASFNFLHISSGFPRKGIEVLLKAYAQSFSADDDVCLVIKTFPNPHQRVRDEVEAIRNAHGSFPRVLVIDEDWPQEQIAALYREAQAFVAPSRGEGFGLPLAEAMLFEVPVITTAWGGQTDFCTPETAWLCDYRFAKAQTHLGLTHSLWAEPDVDHLAQLMKELTLIESSDRVKRVSAAREFVEATLTWEQCARRNREAIEKIGDDSSCRKEPKIAWISTWNSRCGIANYSRYLTQSFPYNRLLVLANHVLERTAVDNSNVIRCWNSEQEEDFSFALEHIVEQEIGAVVIQYNFGFSSLVHLEKFCHQLQGRGIRVYLFLHATADADIYGTKVSLNSIKASLARLDGIFVHGVQDMNRLQKWGLVENVVYFPHGVNRASELSSGKHPYFDGVRTIASYGFLLPHKGISELVHAFAALDHEVHEYRLLLVTALYPNPISQLEFKKCSELILSYGLEGKVKFITEYLAEEESLALLRNADVILFPYQGTQESSSAAVRVGLEAGKPVWVSPLKIFDDVREAVQVMEGGDRHAIQRALEAYFSGGGIVAQDEERAHAWFEERSWPKLSYRLLNIIDQDALHQV